MNPNFGINNLTIHKKPPVDDSPTRATTTQLVFEAKNVFNFDFEMNRKRLFKQIVMVPNADKINQKLIEVRVFI